MKDNATQKDSINFSPDYTKEGLLALIDALPLAITVIDENMKVVLANTSSLKLVNKNKERFVGHVGGDAFGCIHHDDTPKGCGFGVNCLKCKMRDALQKTIDKKESQSMVETTMTLRGHGKRHLRFSTSPLILNENAVVLLSIEDITQSKIFEQTFLEKEKLSVVMQTAGAVCHEMNQPLTIILGMSELLSEDIKEDSDQKENLGKIIKQISRLGEISRKLMTITQYRTKPYLKGEIVDLDASSKKD